MFIYWSLFIDNRSILKSENATRRKKNATTHTNTYTLFSIQEQCIKRTYFTNKICTEKQNTSSDFFPSFWILIFFHFLCATHRVLHICINGSLCAIEQPERRKKKKRNYLLWYTVYDVVVVSYYDLLLAIR